MWGLSSDSIPKINACNLSLSFHVWDQLHSLFHLRHRGHSHVNKIAWILLAATACLLCCCWWWHLNSLFWVSHTNPDNPKCSGYLAAYNPIILPSFKQRSWIIIWHLSLFVFDLVAWRSHNKIGIRNLIFSSYCFSVLSTNWRTHVTATQLHTSTLGSIDVDKFHQLTWTSFELTSDLRGFDTSTY